MEYPIASTLVPCRTECDLVHPDKRYVEQKLPLNGLNLQPDGIFVLPLPRRYLLEKQDFSRRFFWAKHCNIHCGREHALLIIFQRAFNNKIC